MSSLRPLCKALMTLGKRLYGLFLTIRKYEILGHSELIMMIRLQGKDEGNQLSSFLARADKLTKIKIDIPQ